MSGACTAPAPAWLFGDTASSRAAAVSAAAPTWHFTWQQHPLQLLPGLQQQQQQRQQQRQQQQHQLTHLTHCSAPLASITSGASSLPSKARENLQQQPLYAPFTGPPGYTPPNSSSSTSSRQDAAAASWPGQGTAPTVFKQGDKLKQGRYQLKEKILDGRFTSIWRATDQQHPGASVVVKVMEAGDANSFMVGTQEALLHAAAGTHPAVVQVLDAFEQRSAAGRHAVMVLPQEGDNLAGVLLRFAGGVRMGLPLPVVQGVARQVLGALDHLHGAGVVHMGVKPENILLDKAFVSVHEVTWGQALRHQIGGWVARMTGQPPSAAGGLPGHPGCYSELDLEQGQVKLCDFGRSLSMHQRSEWEGCEEAVVWGQPGYRAPEEMLGMEYRAPPYDLWQLGLTCYTLATGQDLFVPQPGPGYDITDKHLGEMTGVLGRLPREFALGSPYYRRYFCPSGRLALEMEYRVAAEPLERILMTEHGFEAAEADEFGGFLRSLLVYDPALRPTAAAALQHPWVVLPLDPGERERHLQEQQRQQAAAAAGQPQKRGWWRWPSKGGGGRGQVGSEVAQSSAQAA